MQFIHIPSLYIYKKSTNNDGGWSYAALSQAQDSKFYELGGEWFYVVKDKTELTTLRDEGTWLTSSNPNQLVSITDKDGVTKSIPMNNLVTTRVDDMNSMFFFKPSFNQDIGRWDVSNVTNMNRMFQETSFNQDIGGWDVSNVTDMGSMFYYNNSFNKDIGGWDVSSVTNMSDMFTGTSFNQDISGWDVSKVTNMYRMFFSSSFNQDIGDWDVSNVTTMSNMFCYNNSFNKDIGGWDVSKVTNMSGMFIDTTFNQDISGWTVSSVTDMSGMFNGTSFNQDIGGWDVGKVTNMYAMFFFNSSFNKDIGNWDVSNVTTMKNMFNGCTSFNQDISGWTVSSVSDMDYMFNNATSFDQDLGDWDVSSLQYASNMFYGVTLSTDNYNNLLIGWDSQSVKSNVTFHGGNSVYCGETASRAREALITDHGWTIIDGGRCPDDMDYFFDEYAPAQTACSLRQLDSSSSECLIIRRSSDNATQSIGFDYSGLVDINAMESFCGTYSGYVHTWFGQGASASNFTQTVNDRQPRIVNAGTTVTTNGLPAIDFSAGTYCNLKNTSRGNTTRNTYYIVCKLNSLSSSQHLYSTDSGGGTRGVVLEYRNDFSKFNIRYASVANIKTSDAWDTNQNLVNVIAAVASDPNLMVYKNNSIILNADVFNPITPNTNTHIIGAQTDGSSGWKGTIQEVIVYDTYTTANRSDITGHINTFWNIY